MTSGRNCTFGPRSARYEIGCISDLLIYRMENVLTAAVKNRSWQGANGIITEGSDNTKNNDGIGFKGKGQLLSLPTVRIVFTSHLLRQRSSYVASSWHTRGLRIEIFKFLYTATTTFK